ncbi:MAG: hypothetical protein ACRC62_24310 [Microcoleus sp.]
MPKLAFSARTGRAQISDFPTGKRHLVIYVYQYCGGSIALQVTLPVLPQARCAHPRLYGGQMLLLILLIALLAIGSLLTQVLVLLPIAWLGWLHFPHWLISISIVLFIAWCLAD